jgi:hypothetical protein
MAPVGTAGRRARASLDTEGRATRAVGAVADLVLRWRRACGEQNSCGIGHTGGLPGNRSLMHDLASVFKRSKIARAKKTRQNNDSFSVQRDRKVVMR